MISFLKFILLFNRYKSVIIQLSNQSNKFHNLSWFKYILIYMAYLLVSRLERSKVRVTFFHSGQPQQISPPDPFANNGYDDYDYDHHQHPWKHYDPLDPHGAEQPLLSQQHHNNLNNNNNNPSSQYPSGGMSNGVQTATMPAYDRQIRWAEQVLQKKKKKTNNINLDLLLIIVLWWEYFHFETEHF